MKHFSDEHRANIAASMLGNKNAWKGRERAQAYDNFMRSLPMSIDDQLDELWSRKAYKKELKRRRRLASVTDRLKLFFKKS